MKTETEWVTQSLGRSVDATWKQERSQSFPENYCGSDLDSHTESDTRTCRWIKVTRVAAGVCQSVSEHMIGHNRSQQHPGEKHWQNKTALVESRARYDCSPVLVNAPSSQTHIHSCSQSLTGTLLLSLIRHGLLRVTTHHAAIQI